jgi:hypothetical protein
MNFSRISKAIAGGFSGAFMAVAGTGGVAVTIPSGSPSWEHYVIAGVAGFVVGFGTVYFAPPNQPS